MQLSEGSAELLNKSTETLEKKQTSIAQSISRIF